MGYQVDHLGSFEVSPPMDDRLRSWLDGELSLDPWDAAEAEGLPLDITSYCTWWTGDGDGSTLSWTGAEKSYDGRAWLQWLVDHVLGPAGHSVRGTVHRFAEPESGFVEASRIVADEDGIREEAFPVSELPWRHDGPWLSDAFFHLVEGTPEEAQSTLLAWLATMPLADQPGLVEFLDEVAMYWPDPDGIRAAVAAAGTRHAATKRRRTQPVEPPPGSAKRSWWDRFRGR